MMISDLIKIMTFSSQSYKGCIIDKVGNIYSWKNLFKSENLEEVKKYIDEAILSLNKSILK